MARITLRDYNNEINDLIDHRQIDEAISHCRHILQAYPKHVDTYRLLGKAYLEEQRYGDASDILQRVLSSIPDDFISQIGMSIIREDEMNLDAAIYHMELAFESQPSNHAIQDELRRLFAKRDGIEPPRIRLTRGALARMYAHGHLYEQAISELQTALSEDPKRFDLQTLLAEMLFQADKKVEAAETCTRILEKLPFNLDANRLLATILKESERDEEAKRFQQRWEALDPYAASVTDKITKTEQVADDKVTIEREDWEPSFGDMPDTGQPVWASSLGVSIEDDEAPEEVPDWLSSSEDDLPPAEPSPLLDSTGGDWMAADASSTDSPFSAAEEQPADDWMAEFAGETPQEPAAEADDWLSVDSAEEAKAEPSEQADEEIPDFIKEAGWGESSGEEEPVTDFDQPVTPAEPIAEDAIPEWMKEMAPSEEAEAEAPVPDLGALADIQAEPDPDWEESIKKDTGEPQPEWLAELGEQAEQTPATVEPSREVDPAGFLAGDFGDDDTDDWLASFSQDQPATPEEEPAAEKEEAAGDFGEDDTDGWLSSLSQDQPATPEETPPTEEEKAAGYLAGDFGEDDTDDWLASFSESQPETPDEEPVPAGEPLPETPTDDSDTDDWLASLSEGEPEVPVEEPIAAAEPPAAAPADDSDTDDWLASLSEGKPEVPAEEPIAAAEPPSAAPADDSGTDDWLASLGEPQEEPPAVEEQKEDSAMDWLTSFGEEEEPAAPAPAPEGPLATLTPKPEIEDDTDEFPVIFGEELAQPETPEPVLPDELGAAPEDEEAKGMAWLEGLAAKQGVPEEELVTSPDQRPGSDDQDIPDWLSLSEEPEPTAEKADTPQPAAEEETDFSALFGEPETPSEVAAPATEETVLEDEDDFSMDWLDSISQEAAAEAGAEARADEVPEPEIPTAEEPLGFEEPTPPQEDLSALFGETPQEPAAAPQEAAASAEDDSALDWLQQLGDQEPEQEQPEFPTPEAESDDLAALFGTDEPTPEAPPTPTESVLEDEDDFSMDWLDSISQEAAAEAGAEAVAEADIAEEISPEPTGIEELAGVIEPEDQVEDLSALFGEEPQEEETPKTPPEPAAEPPSVEDEGLAWLESLAAKQGVAEEELVTSPDERTSFADDRTPDWLKELEDDEEPPSTEPPVIDDLDDLDAILDEAEAAVEAKTTEEIEAVLEDEDDFSMDWLDAISQEAAAEAGAEADVDEAIAEDETVLEEEAAQFDEVPSLEQDVIETPPTPAVEDKVPADDTTPEWLKIIEGEETPAPPSEPETPPADISEGIESVEPPTEAEPQPEAEPTPSDVLEEEDDFATGWLESISAEAAAEAGADIEEAAAEIPEPPVAETPEWLTTIEEDTDEDFAVEEIPDMAAIFGAEEKEEPPVVAEPEPEPVQPEEAAPPAPEAEPMEPEDKPTMVPEWLQEIADEKPSAEPVVEPEWLPEVDEPKPQPEIQPAAEEDWQPEAEAPPTPPLEPVAEEPAAAPPVPQTDEVTAAKRSVQSGDLAGAIQQFNAIIKKGKLVEQAIVEIKEALRRHPVNVELWQVLGDAYMKENNLQDALDAYSKAEDLLR